MELLKASLRMKLLKTISPKAHIHLKMMPLCSILRPAPSGRDVPIPQMQDRNRRYLLETKSLLL